MKYVDPLPHYWICDACANKRGGVYFKTCSTASLVECQYCNEVEDFIFPVRDYRWPKEMYESITKNKVPRVRNKTNKRLRDRRVGAGRNKKIL